MMKRASTIILIGIISVLIGLGGYYILYVPSGIKLTYMHIYSDSVKQNIDRSIKNYLATGGTDIQQLSKTLKKNFKIIKKIAWQKSDFDQSEILIEGVKPAFKINNSLIVGNKRRAFSYDLFSSVTGEPLPALSVNKDLISEKLPSHVYQCMKKLPKNYWNSYTMSYSGQNHILLQKDSPKLQFLIRGERDHQDKIELISVIHDDFINRKLSGSRLCRNRQVAYDLRFKDRIYAKVVREGG
jgi:hypothetical protein